MQGRGRGQRGRGRGRGRPQTPPAERLRKTEAKSQVNTEYNPALRAAREEAKGSRRREGQIGDWYKQLVSDYGNQAQAAQQAFSTAEQSTNQRLSEEGQRTTGALQDQAAKDSSFAALVGAPTDAQGFDQAAKGAAALQRQNSTAVAPLTAQRADFVSYAGGQGAKARLAGIQARLDESQRGRKIRTDITAARREKGQAYTSALGKLKRADREAASERAALGLKAKEGAISNRQAQQRIGIERTNAATSERNAATSERSQGASARHYRREDKRARHKERFEQSHNGLTPAEQRQNKEGLRNAVTTARSLFEQKEWPSWAVLEKAVRKESEVSPAQARVAITKLRKHVERQQKVRGAVPHFP